MAKKINNPLPESVRLKIKGYLEGFIEGLLQELRRQPTRARLSPMEYLKLSSDEPLLKPFHDALLPADFQIVSAFERSFSTRLGSTFEEVARLIAEAHHGEAQRSYQLSALVSESSLSELEKMLTQIDRGLMKTISMREMAERLHKASFKGAKREIRVVIDLFVRSRDGKEWYFELKSPMPNKGQCLEVIQRLLRVHLIRRSNAQKVHTYFAMPYNPYGGSKSAYRWTYALRYLPMQDGVWIGEEFWDWIGGKGTYLHLLELYREVGLEKEKQLRRLFDQIG